MADGSHERISDPKNLIKNTFPADITTRDDTKECHKKTDDGFVTNLGPNIDQKMSESCENSESNSSVAAADGSPDSLPKTLDVDATESEERKKRCFDRYDSSESSDSGVAVLSSTESSGSGSSDITDPGSPRSPESLCGVGEEGAGARMPPWASEPAPPGPRRHTLPPQVPARRPSQQLHRRITEFFNHKMKPQNGVKREATTTMHNDTKRKCLPTKNGVTQDLEKYLSYLSQTLSPRLLDISKQAEAAPNKTTHTGIPNNSFVDSSKNFEVAHNQHKVNGHIDKNKPTGNKGKTQSVQHHSAGTKKSDKDSPTKSKQEKINVKGFVDINNQNCGKRKASNDPSANEVIPNKQAFEIFKRRLSESCVEIIENRNTQSVKPDSTKPSESCSKLGKKPNGVTHGPHSITLTPIAPKLAPPRKDTTKKATQAAKRTNRKSSACIANSNNMTWSKANNLKQAELQKQNCVNTNQVTGMNSMANDAAPKINIASGVRQVPMTVNGVAGLNNLNIPATNFRNCHQISIQQPCNGTVSSTNLTSYVAVPQNVMLTTLRIPQNGLTAQAVNQQNNMNAFARQNVNVSSPTKLNGQFVFPLVQNLNGAVVQIPNLMAKMPNFVLPQTSLAQQRQEHLQNQQAQILINGTLLKLANSMTSPYANVNKPMQPGNQSMPGVNKGVPGMPTVGMTVPGKQNIPNYTVNLSHSVLVPQPGFIVTSVPNMNVKETWSNTSSMCSNHIVHPQTMVTGYSTHGLHTSSIPIAPVKPPDNPIQGTDPPSSTVKETETDFDKLPSKCDIPWLAKNVNNNNVLHSNTLTRPFAQVSKSTEKFSEINEPNKRFDEKESQELKDDVTMSDKTSEEIRRLKEVARREETIFTQITVLKDVSSSVQNSLIDSNYSSLTPESSESGIGTDKSIDSPTDSHASKECDEDSSLSLSISVCSVEVPQSQKSPILKEPKTLRFPPKLSKTNSDKRTSSTDTTSTITVCMWENCKTELDVDTDLLEHLQAVHVESQAGQENYTCQWLGCKVKGKPSCSRLWLERHALSHGGNKPFKCIVDGCGRRFTTQILLERHVNNHFNEQSPNASGGKKSTDSAPKLIRRNGKKLRYRRQPWSARMFDFFDAGTMEGLAWRLTRATRWRLGGACPYREPVGRHTLTLHAAVTARRYNKQGDRHETLLSYYPPHVLDDEWVPDTEVQLTKRIEISQLPADKKTVLFEQFCSSYRKSPSPPPKPTASSPPRVQPSRQCTSSRLLNNLISKTKPNCPATFVPMQYKEEEKVEVSGAKKRKMGRRHGGNAFMPCGR